MKKHIENGLFEDVDLEEAGDIATSCRLLGMKARIALDIDRPTWLPSSDWEAFCRIVDRRTAKPGPLDGTLGEDDD